MSTKSKTTDQAKRKSNVLKTGGRLKQIIKSFPEWRQRVKTTNGMSILG